MANPLRRMVSSSQVSDWSGQGDGTLLIPSRRGVFSIEYLVIAGGGSGTAGVVNVRQGGAGGAGGYLTSTISQTLNESVTVTVGAGGAASTNQGSNSVFNQITSIGGGHGSSGTGGSGGGGSNAAGGFATAGQGNDGSSGTTGRGGGGGGAGGAGGAGTAGTVNTGSGGGGGSSSGSSAGGAGGSGLVVLKYPDNLQITIGSGLTASTATPSGGFIVTTFTSGTGSVSFA